jgi:hypothetical protein
MYESCKMYIGQSTRNTTENPNITTTTYLLTVVELSLSGSSPYTSTDKTDKKKYT